MCTTVLNVLKSQFRIRYSWLYVTKRKRIEVNLRKCFASRFYKIMYLNSLWNERNNLNSVWNIMHFKTLWCKTLKHNLSYDVSNEILQSNLKPKKVGRKRFSYRFLRSRVRNLFVFIFSSYNRYLRKLSLKLINTNYLFYDNETARVPTVPTLVRISESS